MERRKRGIWKPVALTLTPVIASGLIAWGVSSGAQHTSQQSGQAVGTAARSAHASAVNCFETNSLLWHLDRASYSGYQRDKSAATFLNAIATHALPGSGKVVDRLSTVFAAAADDAYWQPLVNCADVAAHPTHATLQAAVPISTVDPHEIQRTLATPPQPPPRSTSQQGAQP
jgi:hypothetical protein